MAIFDRHIRREKLTLDTCSVFNYYNTLISGDYSFLKDYSIKGDPKKIFDELRLQYDKIVHKEQLDNYHNDLLRINRIITERDYLVTALSILDNPLLTYENYKTVVEQLSVYGFKIIESEELKPQIEKVLFHIRTLNDELKILFSQYGEKKDAKNKLDITKVYEWALVVGKMLNLKYSIDIKTTSLNEWISLNNLTKKVKWQES